MAGRRARRRAVRHELRGGRRELHPARRCSLRGLPLRDRRRSALAGPAPHEHGVDLRIRLARRLLAPVAAVHRKARLPLTVYGVAMALPRATPRPSPPCARRSGRSRPMGCAGSSTATSPLRRKAGASPCEAVRLHTEATGRRPLGWYLGRAARSTRGRWSWRKAASSTDLDSYADDLPYWVAGPARTAPRHSLHARCQRHALRGRPGLPESGDPVLLLAAILSSDVLYAEGATAPKILSVGLHCRLVGRPGRIAALERFLDHVLAHERVWVTRRIDIARHWYREHHQLGATAWAVR